MKKLLTILALAAVISSHLFGQSLMKAMANERAETKPDRFFTSIQIKEGDSLWGIASRYAEDGHMTTVDYVRELKHMNGLYEDTIHAGQYLTVMYFSTETQR